MPLHPKTLADCFTDGVEARARGAAALDNPFPPGTEFHDEWNEGFCASCDLDEDDDPASSRMDRADT